MSNEAFGRLLFGLIAQNVLFIAVPLWWMRSSGRTVQSVGLARPTSRQILLAVGGGLGMAAAGYWLGDLEIWLLRATFPPATFQRLQDFTDAYGAEHLFQRLPVWWMIGLFALVGSALAPIGEEMLFRGMFMPLLQTRLQLQPWGAITGSALIFALLHGSPLAVMPLFLMGVGFAIAYARTGSLWVPIGMHAVNNAVNFLLLTLMRHQ